MEKHNMADISVIQIAESFDSLTYLAQGFIPQEFWIAGCEVSISRNS